MELSNKTAREIWAEIKANPKRARFGYGRKAVLVNIDFQCAYTRVDEFKTAYETDPRQIEYVNALAKRFRALNWPVVWTHVAYAEAGETMACNMMEDAALEGVQAFIDKRKPRWA